MTITFKAWEQREQVLAKLETAVRQLDLDIVAAMHEPVADIRTVLAELDRIAAVRAAARQVNIETHARIEAARQDILAGVTYEPTAEQCIQRVYRGGPYKSCQRAPKMHVPGYGDACRQHGDAEVARMTTKLYNEREKARTEETDAERIVAEDRALTKSRPGY